MDNASLVALSVAVLALLGTILTGWLGRRSAQDSTAVESRRLDLEILKTSVSDLRITVDDERGKSRRLEEKVEQLSGEVRTAREDARRARAQALADAAYIDVLLEHWPRPPEPPPRPVIP